MEARDATLRAAAGGLIGLTLTVGYVFMALAAYLISPQSRSVVSVEHLEGAK